MPPTLGHVLLSVPLFIGAALVALCGPYWAAALAVALYWLGRELAQSFRPSAPTRLVWTWTSTRNFAVPAGVAFAVAAVISAF